MTEIQLENLLEARLLVLGKQLLPHFFHDVQPDDAEVADVLADEPGNIVVADQQQVDRHVFAVQEQLVLALGQFQAAALEQVDRVICQAPCFLHRNLDALLGGIHRGIPQWDVGFSALAVRSMAAR